MTSPRIVILMLAVLQMALAAQAPTGGLVPALTGYVWTWKSAQSDTQVIFEPDGTLITKEKKTSQWKVMDASTLRITFPSQKTIDLVFSPDYSRFTQKNPVGVPTTGAKAQARLAAAKASSPTPPPAAASVKTTSHPDDMALGPNWLPHNVHARKVLLNSLEFYSQAVVGKNPSVPAAIPGTIWGPVTWRMPLDEALKKLPAGARKQREFPMLNLAFPQGSLKVMMMAMDGNLAFEDGCNRFKYISFICDLENRIIGIQLMDPSPKSVDWAAPGPDGVREPYYNFIEDHYNASTTQCVPYQIRDAGKGVKLIKTILFNQPGIYPPHAPGSCPGTVALNTFVRRPYRENVHWYLTAPLAKRLLEIVKAIRDQGLDDQ